MEGRPYEELHEFCDFTLAEQNEAIACKGVPPSVPSDFVPVLKKNVCYIVAAVIFNEKNEQPTPGGAAAASPVTSPKTQDIPSSKVTL